MAYTDEEVVAVMIHMIGPPEPGANTNYWHRRMTDRVVREAFNTVTEGVPSPTVGQLWPRGDRLSS